VTDDPSTNVEGKITKKCCTPYRIPIFHFLYVRHGRGISSSKECGTHRDGRTVNKRKPCPCSKAAKLLSSRLPLPPSVLHSSSVRHRRQTRRRLTAAQSANPAQRRYITVRAFRRRQEQPQVTRRKDLLARRGGRTETPS
jgi:hypothetical protein